MSGGLDNLLILLGKALKLLGKSIEVASEIQGFHIKSRRKSAAGYLLKIVKKCTAVTFLAGLCSVYFLFRIIIPGAKK